jgi:hypothetical protein
MGKWAAGRKRGTARQQGFLAAPGSADWSCTGTSTTAITATQIASMPPGADGFRAYAQISGAATRTQGSTGSGGTSIVSGLTTGTTYNVAVCWCLGLAQVSDWSAIKTATTL